MLMASPQWMFETDLSEDIISNSLRFNDGDSAHLTFTPSSASSATDRRKITHSVWVKRGALGTGTTLYSSTKSGGSDYYQWRFSSDDKMTLILDVDDSNFGYDTEAVFRDTTNWYHFVLIIDTTQSTDTDRVKLYANGVLQTISNKYGSNVSQNFETYVMDGTEDAIGEFNYNSSTYFDGYMAEFVTIIGQNTAVTDFGKDVDGVWLPKDTSGLTFGGNGFRLQFKQTGTSANASGMGADTSGNTNHFTPTNLAAGDVVIDTPENNFCTINSLYDLPSGWTFSEGNLKYTTTTNQRGFVCNQNIPLGNRVYWETRVESFGASDDEVYIGVAAEGITSGNLDENRGGGAVDNALVYAFSNYDNNVHLNSSTAAGTGPGQYRNSALPTVVGCAVDRANHTIKWNLDGGAFSSEFTIPSTNGLFPFVGSGGGTNSAVGILNFGQDDTFAGAVSSNGITGGGGKFRHTVPAGYNALCSRNLSEPKFSGNPNRPENANDNFNPYGYTADNTDNKARTGMGFQPDFLWFKDRDTGFSHNLYDSSRGANKYIQSNNTGTENTTSDLMSSFDSDGFTTQNDSSSGNLLNYSSDKYIAWSWKANAGTTSSNDSGDITTTVQVNTKAGFSIITYTGSGTDGNTIGHGLNQQPDFIIGTPRDSSGSNRVVWHKEISLGTFLKLNLTDAVATSDQFVSVSDTLIGVGGNANLSGKAQVIWCWHEIEGYSKFGKYTGNGNANGAYIHLGFKPALVATKKTSGTGNWYVNDSTRSNYNPTSTSAGNLYWESSGTESGNGMDLLSSGFKIRNTDSSQNASGGTYVYMAWAESPFKYSNAV